MSYYIRNKSKKHKPFFINKTKIKKDLRKTL